MRGTIDIDPFPIEVHGKQAGGAWHGHYHKTMYYPMVASFSAEGSYESSRLGEGFIHALLRRGNAAGAEGMARFTREAIRKGRALATHLDARIDAGLVEGQVLDTLDNEAVRFVGRIKNNARLDKLAAPYLSRNPGRPTKEGGTFEDRLGEFNAVIGNGLSAASFEANEASLPLKLLAYNLAGMLRGKLEDDSGTGWDLKRVQRTVLKAGARVARHSQRIFVDVAQAAGVLWGRLLERIARWWRDEAWGRRGPRWRRWVAPPAHAHLCLVLRE